MLSLPDGLDLERLFGPLEDCVKLGLAVSGGADSLALMALAVHWHRAAPGRPELIVYTLDHGLRAEAQSETRQVASYARTLGLVCRTLKWAGEKPRAGIQAAARKARYTLIGAAMAEDGAELLLTAHHLGDQAETMLMRMAHGSGVSGLAGMRGMAEVEGVRVYRPLLEIDEKVLRGIVSQMGWDPVEDPSNRDPVYERVRWRGALRDHLAPLGLDARRLGRLAQRLSRIDDVATAESTAFHARHVRVDAYGVVAIDRAALSSAHREIAVRVLEHAVGWAGGGQKVGLAAIEDMAMRLEGDDKIIRTLSGAQIRPERDRVLIWREEGRLDVERVELVCGQDWLWDNRFAITSAEAGLTLEAARGLTRAAYREHFGQDADAPLSALRAAPLVRNRAGEIVALGCKVLDPGGIKVQLTLT